MTEITLDFCNKVAELSLKHFKELPKSGKPKSHEWTVLATITKHDIDSNNMEIVALGTGSRCIGATKMSPNGDILNDSHAEVICRRAFLRYLYHEIQCALETSNNKVFQLNENKQFVLNRNLSFHFFTTRMPCGDAAIFPKQSPDNFGNCCSDTDTNKKCELVSESCAPNKKRKINEDLSITGGKCLDCNSKPDAEVNNYILGAVRNKPGRGDPTLSVSCSDKIAKWSFVGIQGALLTILIQNPIYLSSITVAGGVPFSELSLCRAIQNRFQHHDIPKPYYHHVPLMRQANYEFECNEEESKRPCPSSIIWSKVPIRPIEVAVDGRRQGVTRKNIDKGRLLISKKELFKNFMNIINANKSLLNLNVEGMSYAQVKDIVKEYNETWTFVKTNIFKIWTLKDRNLLNFL